MIQKFPTIICLFLILQSCHVKPVEGVDFKEVNQEINARKIKKLSDADIAQAVYQEARLLAQKASTSLGTDSLQCPLKTDLLWTEKEALFLEEQEVCCQPKQSPYPKEKEVWEAYAYNLQNGLKPDENLQRLTDELFLFTYPLPNPSASQMLMLRLVIRQKEVIKKVNMKEIMKGK